VNVFAREASLWHGTMDFEMITILLKANNCPELRELDSMLEAS